MPVYNIFIVSAQLFIYLYLTLLILSDLTYIFLFAILGIITATLYRFKFALPNHSHRFQLWMKEDGDASSTAENKFKPLIVAHRTLALECPENSMSGIRQTAVNGFHAVEFDVRSTSDGIPILFHDPNIDRVTNDCGRVEDLTFDELQLLDISNRHLLHKSFENEKIPTLKAAISECLSLNLKMMIDIKTPNNKMLNTLLETYKNYEDLYNQSVVVSVSPIFLYKLKKRNPRLMTGLVWRPCMLSLICPNGNLEHGSLRYKEKWKQLLAMVGDPIVDWMYNKLLWYFCGADVFLGHRDAMNREYVKEWKRRGVTLLAWPVNNPIEKSFLTNVLQVGYLTDTHLPFP